MNLDLATYCCPSEFAVRQQHVVDVQTNMKDVPLSVEMKCIHCGKQFDVGSALFLLVLYDLNLSMEERHKRMLDLLDYNQRPILQKKKMNCMKDDKKPIKFPMGME